MNNELIISAREVIGDYLSSLRKEKGISKYAVIQKTGIPITLINAIESGKTAYTIDSLLKYTTGIGAYVFFGDKSGKDEKKTLDENDIIKKCEDNDPFRN